MSVHHPPLLGQHHQEARVEDKQEVTLTGRLSWSPSTNKISLSLTRTHTDIRVCVFTAQVNSL